MMIPTLITIAGSPWRVLPPGLHPASLDDVDACFAINHWRRVLFDGLVLASERLRHAGCPTIFLDGSYVSAKPIPGDYDACWDPVGIDPLKLDPVFIDFSNGRAAQKAAFKGEFFPSTIINLGSGQAFVEFFQVDRFTGNRKGILSISLVNDPVLLRRVQP
jgi:hypothetical protein